MREQILAAVKKALEGSKKVKITFKREAINEVNYLFGMLNSQIIGLSPGEMTVLVAVRQSGRWDGDLNRTYTVTITDKFDESWFVGRMWRALEKIEEVA